MGLAFLKSLYCVRYGKSKRGKNKSGKDYIKMEACLGGSLESLIIKEKQRFSAFQLISYTCQLLVGLEWFYDTAGYLHQDMKTANVVVTHNGQLKICDVGFASKLESGKTKICGGTYACISLEHMKAHISK